MALASREALAVALTPYARAEFGALPSPPVP
ncbi:hypothetical protein R69888_02448 [Paraburkholderia haematera]|uniref:Uncharacterized protein n=1 Tax=Paraburkholderia haematera TaxID=2793077 RepID=A0ABM8R935_9BURK|nr:hypothetical protein R69888_02448 [Paraburkholderia haematera]